MDSSPHGAVGGVLDDAPRAVWKIRPAGVVPYFLMWAQHGMPGIRVLRRDGSAAASMDMLKSHSVTQFSVPTRAQVSRLQVHLRIRKM